MHPAYLALIHSCNNLRARLHEFIFALDDRRDTADARANAIAALNVAFDAMIEFRKHFSDPIN